MRSHSPKPPRWTTWLLHQLCHIDDKHSVIDDLDMEYQDRVEKKGRRPARFWYTMHVLRALPELLFVQFIWSLSMFKNYMKIALRNMGRQKGYSFINIFGLAVGMACTILIFLWVQDETSYDAFYENSDRIYRVVSGHYESNSNTPVLHTVGSSPAVGTLLKNTYPNDIAALVRVIGSESIIQFNGKKFKEERLFAAEKDFFQILSSQFIAGNPSTSLDGSGKVVISESISRKYFGHEDPLGKVLRLNNRVDFEITGVIKDVPHHSHFKFELIVSMASFSNNNIIPKGMLSDLSDWRHNWFKTYILFKENIDVPEFEKKFNEFLQTYLYAQNNGNVGRRRGFHFQPLRNIHLNSHYVSEWEENGKIEYVIVFSAIAVLILLLACINFMNLSTARSMRRSKEIGLRKVSGAVKTQIIRQFLTESILMALIAIHIAILLVQITLPYFNHFTSKSLELNFNGNMIVTLLVVCVATGLLAGSYPAFFVSAFHPVIALKQLAQNTDKGSFIRQVLIVAQFTISITLMICIGMISRQMSFLKTVDLGYERHNLIIVPTERISEENLESFKTKLNQHRNIEITGTSNLIPTHPLWNQSGARTLDGENPGDVPFHISNVVVDYDFFDAYQIKIVAGRSFSRAFQTDASAFVLNETAIRELGWGQPQNAIDRPFEFGDVRGTIIGVAKDIYFESLHNSIRPTLYGLGLTHHPKMAIRIRSEEFEHTIQYVNEVWDEFHPNGLFEYTFLDDTYNQLYRSEDNLGRVVQVFTILAVIIACLGLLGLTSFTVERRTKEIGVRKVMGATVPGIVLLLTNEFNKKVIISNVFAWPAAWFAMTLWLQNFPIGYLLKSGHFYSPDWERC